VVDKLVLKFYNWNNTTSLIIMDLVVLSALYLLME